MLACHSTWDLTWLIILLWLSVCTNYRLYERVKSVRDIWDREAVAEPLRVSECCIGVKQ